MALLAFGIAFVLWAALVVFLYHYRIWLPFYVVGSVGLAFLLIVAGTRLTQVERWLEMAVAYSAHGVSRAAGIPTRVFEAAPGNILVWVIVQDPGWTVVRVDLECSGMLEMSVLSGLLAFYPAWTLGKRAWLMLAGWMATWAANVVRIVVIILILHVLGKRSIYIAHTIVGRIVFSVLAVALYWVVFTRGTVHVLSQRLKERMRA